MNWPNQKSVEFSNRATNVTFEATTNGPPDYLLAQPINIIHKNFRGILVFLIQ